MHQQAHCELNSCSTILKGSECLLKVRSIPDILKLVEVTSLCCKRMTEGCLCEVTEEEGFFSCVKPLSLKMRHVSVRFVSQLLTDEQNKTACLWLKVFLCL